jgi:group I intron endonuclease
MLYKIYLITNLLNLKQYVGITKFSIEERFLQHIKKGFLLTEAIQKYGKDKFSIELIVEVESPDRAYELEQHYIKKYNTKAPNGYNLTDGGDGIFGWEPSEEYRKECSERIKQLHNEKKVGMYGKKHTEETKKKMSDAAKGKEKPWLSGRKISEETKEKISQSNKGKKLSEETKQKISKNHHNVSGKNNPMFGKKHSQETIEKLKEKSKNRPKRIWINDGKIETCISISEKLPEGFSYGRVKFKRKSK